MHIYHFILDHRTGGPHIYVQGLSKFLHSFASSTLATAGAGEATEWQLANLRHRSKFFYPIEVLLNSARIYWRFRKKTLRSGVVFDVHGAANIAPIIAGRMLRVAVVWHFHENLTQFGFLVRIGKFFLRGVPHKFVIVAERARRVFDLPEAKLISGGVDVSFWTPSTEKMPKNKTIKLLSVGNINPLKGHDLLLSALEKLQYPCELTIVGAELHTFLNYATMLRDRAKLLERYGICLEFEGFQARDVVRKLLNQTDIFVLSSRNEACPLALLEAMSVGCACVATDVGDVSDILSSSENGILVSAENVDALAEGLQRAVSMTSQARSLMGQHARGRVVERYSLERMAESHRELYTEVIRKI